MIGSGFIEFGTGGITLLVEAGDENLADGDPVARRNDLRASADVFEDISDVFHFGNGMRKFGHGSVGGMTVRIDEARENEFAAEVNDFGIRPAKLEDIAVAAGLKDAAIS